MILKRVGEIKEAPEFQAKKKHEAQLYMKKMRELKKLESKKLATATGSSRPQLQAGPSKLKVKSLEELAKPCFKKVHVVSKEVSGIKKEGLQSQIKKVRVLTQAEVETMKKNRQTELKKIRVLTQSQLKRMKLQPSLITKTLEQPISKSKTIATVPLPRKNHAEVNEMDKIRKNINKMLTKSNQNELNGEMNISLKDESTQIEYPDRARLEDLMGKSIDYFDSVSAELNKISPFYADLNVSKCFQFSIHIRSQSLITLSKFHYI